MKKYIKGLLAWILVLGSIIAIPVVSPVYGETHTKTPAANKIVLPQLFKGTDATGQKMKNSDQIALTAPLSPVTFYADQPGNWSVTGTGQSGTNTQTFTVIIPEQFVGFTLQLTYTPSDPRLQQLVRYRVQITTPPPATGSGKGNFSGDMDIVARGNIQSTFQTVGEDLISDFSSTYTVYQDPIYEVWVATDADHFRFGSRYGSDEGSGVWSVNGVVLDDSYLNFDRTAVKLSKFGEGTYTVSYMSKDNPQFNWSRKIRLYKGILNISDTCDSFETGPILPDHQLVLLLKDRQSYLIDGSTLTITSKSQLANLSEITLFADRVYSKGKKKVKNDSWSYLIPNLDWEYEEAGFGENHSYLDGRISSMNQVEVVFLPEGKVKSEKLLVELGSDSERDGYKKGEENLDLSAIIKENNYRKGTYTITITNNLSRESCSVDGGRKSIDTSEKTQALSATVHYQ